MNDPTIVRTFSDRGEAEIARGLLEAEGIPALLTADDLGSEGPGVEISTGTQLVVDAKDVARAQELLDMRVSPEDLDAAERESESPR
jgi:Putative prokaryotic signal transducing protein